MGGYAALASTVRGHVFTVTAVGSGRCESPVSTIDYLRSEVVHPRLACDGGLNAMVVGTVVGL